MKLFSTVMKEWQSRWGSSGFIWLAKCVSGLGDRINFPKAGEKKTKNKHISVGTKTFYINIY